MAFAIISSRSVTVVFAFLSPLLFLLVHVVTLLAKCGLQLFLQQWKFLKMQMEPVMHNTDLVETTPHTECTNCWMHLNI